MASMRHACTLLVAFALAQSPHYDILITGGRVLDGSGTPAFRADVAIRGDTIAALGSLPGATADLVLDARNRVIAPGFIDIHNHSLPRLLAQPAPENFLRQGITTVIDGNDGRSPIPLGPFFDRLSRTPLALNFGTFAGQGSIREAVLGSATRPATPSEIHRMQDLLRQAMRDGAFGLSTGLFYVPGRYTSTEEVIALARVAAEFHGIYISHLRDEASHVIQSVEEAIRIGEQARLPVQLTHHKIVGAPNWGRSVETLRLVEQARARGLDVTIDQYPYTASMTSLSAALGAPDRPTVIDRIRNERGGGDPKNIVLAACPAEPALNGQTLAEVTAARGLPPTIENAAEVALSIVRRGDCTGIFHALWEQDVERILRFPFTMIATDADIPAPGEFAHPRSYGTYPRVLGLYVREKHLLTLEEAVRKMTSLPAARLNLPDRGLLRTGFKADLVIFDPATVAEPAQGIDTVLVNGQPVLLKGRLTPSRPGRLVGQPPGLRRPLRPRQT
jgi:N-acyl-D-amino-acid deacylase